MEFRRVLFRSKPGIPGRPWSVGCDQERHAPGLGCSGSPADPGPNPAAGSNPASVEPKPGIRGSNPVNPGSNPGLFSQLNSDVERSSGFAGFDSGPTGPLSVRPGYSSLASTQ